VRRGGDSRPTAGDRDESAARGSVQSVHRAMQLLMAVARGPADGVRLSELAATTGLDRATTHRLLATLVGEGLIEQDPHGKRYLIGMEFFSLAAAASNRYDIADVAHETLLRLAEQTGDSAFFCLRSGNDYICVDVQTGAYPIKTLPVDIGSRSPLGAGATGIAYLAALPESEADQILALNRDKLALYPGQDEASLRAGIAAAREKGYAVSPKQRDLNVTSVSVAMSSRRGRPISSLSLAAISERLNEPRQADVAAMLSDEARRIEDLMWRMPDDHRHRTTWARGARGR